MKVHLIATGGAVMHNMALALHDKGYEVSGSDDEIFDPAKSRLEKQGLLPEKWGWFPDKITSDIDIIILGMHARQDNPELLRAQELGLKIYSFPEYLYENCKDKTRVVIGGSHGKTTTTSMVMHVLKFAGIDFDYMVGAQIEGFDRMVKLSHDAKIAIFEGDEYLSSPIDMRPKFHLYKPHIASISGIAWDHINVFPTFGNYVEQFSIFADQIEKDGTLIYYQNDEILTAIAIEARQDILKIPYSAHPHHLENGVSFLKDKNREYPIQVFGTHNLENISCAKFICQQLGLSEEVFYQAITHFSGAAKRLQLLKKNSHSQVFLDFAHSPSKLKATTSAVKEQFPNRILVACMELHTFSSLNSNFLEHYMGCMGKADLAVVYFDKHTLQHKKLEEITPEQVRHAFGGNNVEVMNDAQVFRDFVSNLKLNNTNLLLMSSGNFSGIDFIELANHLIPDLV
ncbi:MAG: peptidoglycan synthetase [Bacteroidales bacterium]|nr:peptidoglycan synthetase [Bacteroidales bacterium]MCF8458632.1 peptidoglycan synthetase [Bacteroidales bacterium]